MENLIKIDTVDQSQQDVWLGDVKNSIGERGRFIQVRDMAY